MMLRKILMTTALAVALIQPLAADTNSTDDYNNYGTWSVDGKSSVYGVGGYIDNKGLLGGNRGDEYIIFHDTNDDKGYIYRVTVDGDPNAHPDANGQPIADRNFTYVSSSTGGIGGGWGDSEFYVDDTGIYYGDSNGIKRWDLNWSNETQEVAASGTISTETLAKNASTDEWWTCTRDRRVYRYNAKTKAWDYQFTYPSLGGDHHDGMEIVNDKLYLSDMTTDKIIVYDLNATGDVVADSNVTYTYTDNKDVEGMGFGPNQHFWFSYGTVYEVGDGKLVPTCSQDFYYAAAWDMQTSDCDDITVPGIDDAVLLKLTSDGELVVSTADAGAKTWFEALGFTVVDEVTLKTGEGFWTYAKRSITQTVSSGKARNNYIELKKGEYSFIGFNTDIDLDEKFGKEPVDTIWFYDTKWHAWQPGDGSQNIPEGQGIYVLPTGDFNVLLK